LAHPINVDYLQVAGLQMPAVTPGGCIYTYIVRQRRPLVYRGASSFYAFLKRNSEPKPPP